MCGFVGVEILYFHLDLLGKYNLIRFFVNAFAPFGTPGNCDVFKNSSLDPGRLSCFISVFRGKRAVEGTRRHCFSPRLEYGAWGRWIQKTCLRCRPLRSEGSVLLLFVANGDISLALTPDIKENGSDLVGWQLFAVDIKRWFYDRTSQPTVFCIERSLVPLSR